MAADDDDGDADDHDVDDHDDADDAHAHDDDDYLRVACYLAAPVSHVTPERTCHRESKFAVPLSAPCQDPTHAHKRVHSTRRRQTRGGMGIVSHIAPSASIRPRSRAGALRIATVSREALKRPSTTLFQIQVENALCYHDLTFCGVWRWYP